MNTQVRVGVVGTSWWADGMYLPALKSHAGASIRAICGRNQERAGEMAKKYDIPQVFSDYREMIARGDLDAIVVAVPDDLHFPITMAALEAGLHVINEKPMAFNLDQARKMLAKAEAAGVKHMTYFTLRWAPHFQTLLRLVNQGYIGRCFDAQFRFIGGYAREGKYRWRWDRQHGLGILGDLGSHMIDLARLTVGEIASVQASLAVRVHKDQGADGTYKEANDSATLTLRFANGATGTIFTSAAAEIGDRGQEQRVTLYGENGTLEVSSDFSNYTIRGVQNKGDQFQDIPVPAEFLGGFDPKGHFMSQVIQKFLTQPVGVRLFIDSILEDRPVTPGFLDGVKVQEVLEAAFESDRRGCWVDVGQQFS